MRTEDDWKRFVGDQLRQADERDVARKTAHDELVLRVQKVERKLDENTVVTERIEQNTGLILDAMGGLRGLGKFFKWFSVVVVPVVTLWFVWKGK